MVVFFMLPALKGECDPTYAKVDSVLELITKSKSLHVLMVLDRARRPLRFTELKHRVDASSTTVSRRLGELERGVSWCAQSIHIRPNPIFTRSAMTVASSAPSCNPCLIGLKIGRTMDEMFVRSAPSAKRAGRRSVHSSSAVGAIGPPFAAISSRKVWRITGSVDVRGSISPTLSMLIFRRMMR